MFTGFREETLGFFLDLKFHNSVSFFHANHDRYVREVQQPFYSLIEDLAPDMLEIDAGMEVRPYKCLSHIHRDTRFTRDKSPYRDHLWLLFRHAAESRDQSLNYWFEFGPSRLSWGMGFWGENREVMDQFRRYLAAKPGEFCRILKKVQMEKNGLVLEGRIHKRMDIPPELPDRMERWYRIREMYISQMNPDYHAAFSSELVSLVRKDFQALAPLYRLFRNMMEEPDLKGEA